MTKEQALFGNPVTACKVPLSELLAIARPETSQEPEGGLFPGADGSPGEAGLGPRTIQPFPSACPNCLVFAAESYRQHKDSQVI